MMRNTSPDHPVSHAMLAPLQRLIESAWADRLIATATVALTLLWRDLFVILWFLALASAITDTVYGRRLHKILDDYDHVLAEIGLLGKLAGLTMALFVRGIEWAVVSRFLLEVDAAESLRWLVFAMESGLFSAAMAATLLGQDLRSIQEKRERFGQEPIPIFTTSMVLLDKAMRRLTGSPPLDSELRHRRKGDRRENDER